MEILFPRLSLKRLPGMLKIAALGAILAGIYGALHDQLSYSISPEYFTKMKFDQFSWANLGWPPRAFASEVGFLASWWVGAIGGWILARVGLDQFPPARRRSQIAKAFAIVFLTAIAIGGIGLMFGVYMGHHTNLSGWRSMQNNLELDDLPSFVVVAYLHWASYLGALLGVISAAVYVRQNRIRPAAIP
jgi:hypothetical protein